MNKGQGQRQYEHAEMRDKLDNNDQRFGRPSFQSKSSNHSRGNQFNDQRHDFRDNQLPPHRQRYHPQDNIPQSQPYFNPQERGDNYQHHQHGPKNYHPQQQFGNQGQSQQRRDNYLSRSRSNEHFPVSPNDQMPPRRSHEMHEQSLSYRNVPPVPYQSQYIAYPYPHPPAPVPIGLAPVYPPAFLPPNPLVNAPFVPHVPPRGRTYEDRSQRKRSYDDRGYHERRDNFEKEYVYRGRDDRSRGQDNHYTDDESGRKRYKRNDSSSFADARESHNRDREIYQKDNKEERRPEKQLEKQPEKRDEKTNQRSNQQIEQPKETLQEQKAKVDMDYQEETNTDEFLEDEEFKYLQMTDYLPCPTCDMEVFWYDFFACDECDVEVCLNCRKPCKRCNFSLCPNCTTRCNICEASNCNSCFSYCSSCLSYSCKDCSSTCQDCGPICVQCISEYNQNRKEDDDFLCPTCFTTTLIPAKSLSSSGEKEETDTKSEPDAYYTASKEMQAANQSTSSKSSPTKTESPVNNSVVDIIFEEDDDLLKEEELVREISPPRRSPKRGRLPNERDDRRNSSDVKKEQRTESHRGRETSRREDTNSRKPRENNRREEVSRKEEIPKREEISRRDEMSTRREREEEPRRGEEVSRREETLRRDEAPYRREENSRRDEISSRREETGRRDELSRRREEVHRRDEVSRKEENFRQQESSRRAEEPLKKSSEVSRKEEVPKREETSRRDEISSRREAPKKEEVSRRDEVKREEDSLRRSDVSSRREEVSRKEENSRQQESSRRAEEPLKRSSELSRKDEPRRDIPNTRKEEKKDYLKEEDKRRVTKPVKEESPSMGVVPEWIREAKEALSYRGDTNTQSGVLNSSSESLLLSSKKEVAPKKLYESTNKVQREDQRQISPIKKRANSESSISKPISEPGNTVENSNTFQSRVIQRFSQKKEPSPKRSPSSVEKSEPKSELVIVPISSPAQPVYVPSNPPPSSKLLPAASQLSEEKLRARAQRFSVNNVPSTSHEKVIKLPSTNSSEIPMEQEDTSLTFIDSLLPQNSVAPRPAGRGRRGRSKW